MPQVTQQEKNLLPTLPMPMESNSNNNDEGSSSNITPLQRYRAGRCGRYYTQQETYILRKMLYETYGLNKRLPRSSQERANSRDRLNMTPKQLSAWIANHNLKEKQAISTFAKLYHEGKVQDYDSFLEHCYIHYANNNDDAEV
ncbi:hypothetical protein BDB00DRAFT_790618 [Zychaea mexicana]|uniref:uncharacterized protein n=1 Tax=Zychaea mexicana TaxID=64656 RepID=UPI0022FDE29C|nr:uncharacterized protein BDB00DRAFT_790618 [Zychaea mexicana]KAI9490120.1 hypothetical protein BDB00DRAFT_790618 [Zychaea mexicana]